MSDAAPTSRETIRARIDSSSKDAVVLEEMRRLGFWPNERPSPAEGEAAALIAREAKLVQELNAINRDLALVQDSEAALKAMRKERMAAAKARREETKQKHAQLRYQRAQAWYERQGRDIVHAGEGVSEGLADARCDAARLAQQQLPTLDGPLMLAEAMGISLAELRFLVYHRSVSRISHYRRFGIAKKTGGVRIISAPMPRLKRAQYWVLDRLLAKLPVHDAAHGFVAGRNIVGNAGQHVGRAVVLNLDLQNFFPSIAYPRVRGLFQSFGYSRQMATLLALICTETPTEEVELDGNRYHVQSGPRCLPQGAPTSPMITNLLCRRLDRRLSAAAAKLGFRYTRYADDMTFSADQAAADGLTRLLWRVKRIIADEGFTLHPDKQRIMRAASRQEVTGIVVNQRPAVCRDTLRRFRATLFQVEKDGPLGKTWNGNANVISAMEGYARFIRMVDPAKGEPLCQRVAALRGKWGSALAPLPTAHYRRLFRAASAAGQQPPGRVWMAAGKAAPVLEKTAEQLRAAREAVRAQERASLKPQNSVTPAPAQAPRQAQGFAAIDALARDLRAPTPPSAIQPAAPSAKRDKTPKHPRYLPAQCLLLMILAVITENWVFLLGCGAWLYYGLHHGKASVWHFVLTIAACQLLWRLFQ